MKPRVVSVKQLKIKRVPPPSEKDVVFLEKYGQPFTPYEEKQTGFFAWLSKIFGK